MSDTDRTVNWDDLKDASLFATFEKDQYLTWAATDRDVKKLLENKGGAFGVSGPRGGG